MYASVARSALDRYATFGDNIIMTHVVFDRALVGMRRRRAAAAGAQGGDFLLRHAAADLALRLGAILKRFPIAVDLASGSETVADALRASGKVDAMIRTDTVAALLASSADPVLVADEEALPFAEGSLDLVVSLLALQNVNDLPGMLVQARRALKPDGLFLACLAGGATLKELREAFAQAEAELDGGVSPRVAPFADVRDMGGLLQRAGFALPVADVDALVVRYADVFGLMRDLRAMGATNALVERRRKPLRRATLLRMAEIYAERFAAPDGRIPATFELVWVSGWAPHESQPKPLRPGSAKARLADALGTVEQSTGEKAGG